MAASLDTTHLRNVGEFFSQHYLSEVLAGDLRDVFAQWKQAEVDKKGRRPSKRLAALSEPYFRTLAHVAHGDRDEVARESVAFHASVLEALGYTRKPTRVELPGGTELPLSLTLDQQGKPFLWVGEAAFPDSEDTADPLESPPLCLDSEADGALFETRETRSWRALLDGPVVRQDHAPRWVLLLAGPDIFLIDRDKWSQGKYLHLELGAMLGHRKPAALRAAAALLHRDVLVPEGGRSVIDEIDEKSYKHAFAVSTDLKHGVQESIELIGNEALWYRRNVAKQKTFELPELAQDLSRECITYLYRLLMLFYVEARGGELGVVPMQAEPYREGLSLESLRELELVPLATKKARDGTYFHQTLEKLFSTIHLGWPQTRQRGIVAQRQFGDTVDLVLPPQRSPLFDPANTPILRAVKLRNHVLQQVIRRLSLSREGGRSSQRGRISYAQLGINQLGAVYEGLLAYTGFFAQEELFELQNPKDKNDESARVFYVPASKAGDYRDNEFRTTVSGAKISHPKGTFLFRLAGRDRERSASFYTPEVLTRCLTKYTLMERLGDSVTKIVDAQKPANEQQGLFADAHKLSADEILQLTVCEPAMGSGAFLGEAVQQLATAYLAKKSAELGEDIPAEDYAAEHAKVRYHFVAHNCYGVDLNPLATELGKVSLWLGVLQPGVQAPFVDLRLRVGNSLIGARKEVFAAADLTRKPNKKATQVNWLEMVPTRVAPGEKRPNDAIYHFLVPDAAMAAYESDKVVKKLCVDEVKKLKAWRKAQTKPFTEIEVARLQTICDDIDQMWQAHVAMRTRVLESLRQPVQLWGQPEHAHTRWKAPEECQSIASELMRPGSPYLRLKAVMDLWCRLWSWPIEKVDKLPTRDKWLAEVEELLNGAARPVEEESSEKFVHWELDFCEVFKKEGSGFDVIVGNPPWIKLQWQEAGILGDLEPSLLVRKHSAKQVADKRAEVFKKDPGGRSAYLQAFSEDTGSQAFLNAKQNYPLLQGVQTNLYKCFMVRCWGVLASSGALGLVHQTGVLDDPKGGQLREEFSQRFRVAVMAINQLKLFPDVGNCCPFAWSITLGHRTGPGGLLISNVMHPTTFEGSAGHDGFGEIPGIRTEGSWDLRPHLSRLVPIDAHALRLFAELYDKPGTPALQARLPVVHSRELLDVLRKFAEAPRKLRGLRGEFYCTEHFHETNQQKDGTIVRETRVPARAEEWVVSGPHFYVGTPFNKNPNEGCSTHRDYSSIDLTQIPADYLPRTNYVPGYAAKKATCTEDEYEARTPSWREQPVTEFYRYINRRMIAPTGERTLAPSILIPGAAHTDLVFSVSFTRLTDIVIAAGAWASLPVDFFVKSTGKGDARQDTLALLPLPDDSFSEAIIHRTLRLNCLTTHYADLWNTCLPQTLLPAAKPDPRLAGWDRAPRTWTWDAPLRTPFARRQALVELDALAALSLGLTVDELLLLYRVQFPVLRQYEAETFYDRRGKIVFTVNRGLSGVGVSRKQWAEIAEAKAGDSLPEWAADAGGPFEPPFDSCDREADMAQAFAYFHDKLGSSVDGRTRGDA